MLKSLDELKNFLETKDKDKVSFNSWIIEGFKIKSEFLGPEGYIPEGLQKISADNLESLLGQLCSQDESDHHSVFVVLALDHVTENIEDAVLSAYRWMSEIGYVAMLLLSKDEKLIAEAEKQLTGKEILNNDALILVHLGQL